MNGILGSRMARATQQTGNDQSAICWLAVTGALVALLTIAAPLAFRVAGDNAFIALTVPAGLLVIAATTIAERAHVTRALWLIIGVAIALRVVAISFEPLLSSDIYRYIWDGKVQAAGINPYRFVPADPSLAALRDAAVFPHINRVDYAVTIYPPVAQFFFLLVTRAGANTMVMRLALLLCEAVSVGVILVLLKRMQRPLTRIVAYLWHPLPIWEIANSGHIDALMVCLMLLGFWLAVGGRAIRGAAVVTLALLVKPLAAPALAVIWRPWNWKMVLAVIAVITLCYAPYLSVGWNVFGFLTKGYLSEEGITSGSGLWLLSLWRLVFGAHQGDAAVYLAFAALVMASIVFWISRRPNRSAAFDLAAINMLLLASLVLLSPNYPWYFVAITPFVALSGNAPTWSASIGALLLTNELDWDFGIPSIVMKSVLFGVVLLAVLWSMRPHSLRVTTRSEGAR
jgi:alpha-1,6-mannosyltransferase